MDGERNAAPRAVFAVQDAVLYRRLEHRNVTLEVENQRAVFERAAGGVFMLLPIEEPAFDIGPIAGKLDFEGDFGPVQVDSCVPEARERLSPNSGRERDDG